MHHGVSKRRHLLRMRTVKTLGGVLEEQDIYVAISAIRQQLDRVERLVRRFVPEPTPIQRMGIEIRQLKDRTIDKDWLERSSRVVEVEDELAEKGMELKAQSQQKDILLPTQFVVSFRDNPGLVLGSVSDPVNGVWFSVVGSHPITGMPIVACHGSMEAGTVGLNLKEALRRGFDGICVTQPFDIRIWDSLDGTWRPPQLD